MDRIIIQVKDNGLRVDRIFLQTDGVLAPNDNKILHYADLTGLTKGAYTNLVNGLEELAPSKPVPTFKVVEPISNHPTDPAITRTASANIPALVPSSAVKVYEMPTVVKHYRDGVYIGTEIGDVVEILRASNERQVDDGEGNMVGEADFFEAAGEIVPLPALMRAQIHNEDDVFQRFDRQYPAVAN